MRQRTVRPQSADFELFTRLFKATPVEITAVSESSTIKIITFTFQHTKYEIRMNYSDSFIRYLPDPIPVTYWVEGTLADEPFEKKFETEKAAKRFISALGVDTLSIKAKGGDEEEELE